jgi:hypothetical protein
VPGYPFWLELTDGARFNSALQKAIFAEYADQAVQPEAGHLDQIRATAAWNRIGVCLGCVERAADRGAFDGNRPWSRAKLFRVTSRIPLIGSELVEVVITGHVLIRCWFLSRAERTLYSVEFRVRKGYATREAKRGGCTGQKAAPAQVDVFWA